MNNLAFKNPRRYWLIMSSVFAVVYFVLMSLAEAIGWGFVSGGIVGHVVFTLVIAIGWGAGMTWWTRTYSRPTL